MMLLAYAFGYDSDLIEEVPDFFTMCITFFEQIMGSDKCINHLLMFEFFNLRIEQILSRMRESRSNLVDAIVIASRLSDHDSAQNKVQVDQARALINTVYMDEEGTKLMRSSIKDLLVKLWTIFKEKNYQRTTKNIPDAYGDYDCQIKEFLEKPDYYIDRSKMDKKTIEAIDDITVHGLLPILDKLSQRGNECNEVM